MYCELYFVNYYKISITETGLTATKTETYSLRQSGYYPEAEESSLSIRLSGATWWNYYDHSGTVARAVDNPEKPPSSFAKSTEIYNNNALLNHSWGEGGGWGKLVPIRNKENCYYCEI